MTTAREYLDRYNVAAVSLGRPVMKAWKGSVSAIAAKVEKIEAELPKSAVKVGVKGELAEWCRANGINPKVARAKLRKENVTRVGTRYDLSSTIIDLLKAA